MADEMESPQNLYAKNLQQSFGYPLRIPEPKSTLPSSYAENGLHIGDVGYVDRNGMFDVLFNICSPPGHELYRNKPEYAYFAGLARFQLDQASSIPAVFPAGRVICHGIHGPQGGKLKHGGPPCKFESYSTSGAVLILPSGAVSQELGEDLEKKFRKLAEQYALKWCQVADRQSLYLITGFYKANSWYLGSFHKVLPTGQALLERDADGEFTWDSRCDYRQSPGDNLGENQTVLISGFKIQVREWDEHVLVEKLSPHPRSMLSKVALQASFILSILLLLLRQIASGLGVYKQRDRGRQEGIGAGVNVNRVPALSQPFHPSDTINRYLLNRNPDMKVAITHDSQWLSMLEEGALSLDDMAKEDHFRMFLEVNYMDDSNGNDVVYLRRKSGPQNEGSICARRVAFTPKMFLAPAVIDGQRRLITRMRAENIIPLLRRMPVGFYVLIQFNGTKKRSTCKPASLHNNTIEWDDEFMLPINSTDTIRFSLIASFEFEPILGGGETICVLEASMGQLAGGIATHLLLASSEETSPCPSLLITLEEQLVHYFSDVHLGVSKCKDRLQAEIIEETDKGHLALLRYHRGEGLGKLNESVQSFRAALDLCPPNHECYAAALVNHAAASFINCQVYGIFSELDDVVASFRRALGFRLGLHPDRPGTLLHLTQILLYRYEIIQDEPIVDEIEALMAEIKRICFGNSYEHRAAGLIAQTLELCRVIKSGTLIELDELISKLDRSARMVPNGSFDRPIRLIKLGVALSRRFEITGQLSYLENSMSIMQEAMQLVPDTHLDKPSILAFLGDALSLRFVKCGDLDDLENTISVVEDALKRVPSMYFDRPRMLTTLGNAHRLRFIQCGNVSGLDNMISMMGDTAKSFPSDHRDLPQMLASLGDALRMRFVLCGAIADLNNSISFTEKAMELISEEDLTRLRILTSFGDARRVQCIHAGAIVDLDPPISMIEQALKLAPVDHVEKPHALISFGEMLRIRYVKHGDICDLERSISALKAALKLIPDNHIEKPRVCAFLGSLFCLRFVHCGEGSVADLVYSITTMADAMECIPEGHLDKPWVLASLGEALHARFLRESDIADLSSSISLMERPVKLTQDGHLGKSWILASLGDSLCARFVRNGNIVDLIGSISMLERGRELAPDGYLDMPRILAFLGNALRERFLQHGDVADLNNAISFMGRAIKSVQEGHLDKPYLLASLGETLHAQFVHGGVIVNLGNSVSVTEEALQLIPNSHLYKPRILSSLSDSLCTHFAQNRIVADLERSIAVIEEALKLVPGDQIDKPWLLASLGLALCVYFVQHGGDVADLDRSVSMIETAVKLAPDGYVKKPRMFIKLGVALLVKFIHSNSLDLDESISVTGCSVYLIPTIHPALPNSLRSITDLTQIERVISSCGDAVTRLPHASPYKAGCLIILASSLLIRFLCLCDTSNLKDAVSHCRNAIKLIPKHHPDRPEYLNSLALSLDAGFENLRKFKRVDVEEAVSVQKQAIKLTPNGHHNKPRYRSNLALLPDTSPSLSRLSILFWRTSTLLSHTICLQRRYIDLIHKISSKWVNWDPRTDIKVGAYGTVGRNGNLIVEGNIYDDDFQKELVEHGIDIKVADYPPQQGPEEDDFIITSDEVTHRDFTSISGMNILNSNLPKVAFQGKWSTERGGEVIFIMHRPRLTYIPQNRALENLHKVDKLAKKIIVTSIYMCPAYCMYLSDAWAQNQVSVALITDESIDGVTTGGSLRWWSDVDGGFLRKGCDSGGRNLFTPLYSVKDPLLVRYPWNQ